MIIKIDLKIIFDFNKIRTILTLITKMMKVFRKMITIIILNIFKLTIKFHELNILSFLNLTISHIKIVFIFNNNNQIIVFRRFSSLSTIETNQQFENRLSFVNQQYRSIDFTQSITSYQSKNAYDS